jgi:hypothetical protein
MKRILLGTALALFGLVPAISSADCSEGHASMASAAPPAKQALTRAPAESKAPVTKVTKVSAKQDKNVAAKKTTASASKADGSTVVARTN